MVGRVQTPLRVDLGAGAQNTWPNPVHVEHRYRWITGTDRTQVQMEHMYIWNTCIYGTQVQMEHGYIWNTGTHGTQVQMEHRYIWNKDIYSIEPYSVYILYTYSRNQNDSTPNAY